LEKDKKVSKDVQTFSDTPAVEVEEKLTEEKAAEVDEIIVEVVENSAEEV
jgi:hypothetical protein